MIPEVLLSSVTSAATKRLILVAFRVPSVLWGKSTKRTTTTNTRTYQEIPQVKGLPLFGTMLDYTPLRGFRYSHIFELWQKRHEQYGDIYREKIVNYEAVFCRSTADLETLFRTEGRLPARPFLKGIDISYDIMGIPTSILNLDGEDWFQLRHPLNELLLKNKMVWRYVNEMHGITKEFVMMINTKMDEKGEVPDLHQWLERWAFEMAGTFAFNKRMGLLRDDAPTHIIDAFEGTKRVLDIVAMLLFGGRFKRTKQLEKSLRQVRDVYNTLIQDQQRDSAEFKNSVLGKIMQRPELTDRQKFSLLFDIALAAVETTARTSEFLLYCLATQPNAQEIMREEIKTLLTGNETELSGRSVNGMKYMNAFFKEVFRLYPISHSFSRVLTNDGVFSGYKIPAGTTMHFTLNSTQNRNPKLFTEPDKFTPERWLDRENAATKFSTTTAFGIGARACPGRFFAMQEMHLLLIEILRNFRVEYKYEPMISIMQSTGILSGKPRFAFRRL